MKKSFVFLIAVPLLLAGCKTSAPKAPADVPASKPVASTWTAAAGTPNFLPVITVEKRPYLLVAHALHSFKWSDYDHLRDLPFPACFEDEEQECPKVMPASEDAVSRVGAPPAAGSVALVTASGLCEPKVGTLAVVNTTGCDYSVALAYPLTGCDGPFAPLAVEGVSKGTALTWSPAVDGKITPYGAGKTLADPGHDQAVSTWWAATVPNEPGVPLDARALLVTAHAEHENVVGRMAAAHLHRPQCEDVVYEMDDTGLVSGGAWTPVAGVQTLAGAMTQGGFPVAILTDDSVRFGIHLRGAGNTFTEGGSFDYYRDNEECYDTGKIGYEQDCAP